MTRAQVELANDEGGSSSRADERTRAVTTTVARDGPGSWSPVRAYGPPGLHACRDRGIERAGGGARRTRGESEGPAPAERPSRRLNASAVTGGAPASVSRLSETTARSGSRRSAGRNPHVASPFRSRCSTAAPQSPARRESSSLVRHGTRFARAIWNNRWNWKCGLALDNLRSADSASAHRSRRA